jgi:hypothetical protein
MLVSTVEEQGLVVDFCEYSNEWSGSIKAGNVFQGLNNFNFSRKSLLHRDNYVLMLFHGLMFVNKHTSTQHKPQLCAGRQVQFYLRGSNFHTEFLFTVFITSVNHIFLQCIQNKILSWLTIYHIRRISNFC